MTNMFGQAEKNRGYLWKKWNCQSSLCNHIIKSPRVTGGSLFLVCFHCRHSANTFQLPGKTLEANFFKPHMLNVWVWENILVLILVTLGQGHQAIEAGQILPCPHDKVRTSHPFATLTFELEFSRSHCIPGMELQGQIWNLLYLRQKWFDCHETKSKHIDWMHDLKWNHWVWPWPWPWPWIFKVKYGICYISAKNGLIATKRKANISIELQASYWPWPWKVRCKDLTNSDRGDFRCRHAVDSSSWMVFLD